MGKLFPPMIAVLDSRFRAFGYLKLWSATRNPVYPSNLA